jgi:hypothetical protein
MSDQKQYDKKLADKLKKLPLPDVEQSWSKMKVLLDEEMPEGGGFSKRRGGWWFYSSVLLLIFAGGWLISTRNLNENNPDPPMAKKPVARSAPTDNIRPAVPANTEYKIEDRAKFKDSNINTNQASHDEILRLNQVQKPVGSVKKSSASRVKNNMVPEKTVLPVTVTGSTNTTGELRNSEYTSEPVTPKSQQIRGPANVQASTADLNAAVSMHPFTWMAKAVGGSYNSLSTTYLSAVKYAEVSKKYLRKNRKYKPASIKTPYSTEGRNFAFGLSLPLGFPLGDQKMLAYNMSGGHNTVTDYVPAPHLQYHINSKSYLQSEIQLVTPQFIRPVLLYQQKNYTSISTTTSSIYARKLYYFNVPVSVHYSPFKHFYMGTGLQFSSLLSGVAMHETVRQGMVRSDSLYDFSYAKFRNDSVSNRLNGNEFRLMLDANYYWNKFTVGLRYNQALSNYVSIRVNAALPYTSDKNKSLQFYMRYNLWEDKKRTHKNRSLALK